MLSLAHHGLWALLPMPLPTGLPGAEAPQARSWACLEGELRGGAGQAPGWMSAAGRLRWSQSPEETLPQPVRQHLGELECPQSTF